MGCRWFGCGHGSDLGLGLVIRLLQVVMDVGDLFQSFLDVINWVGFSW